jgi:hypothetical protein
MPLTMCRCCFPRHGIFMAGGDRGTGTLSYTGNVVMMLGLGMGQGTCPPVPARYHDTRSKADGRNRRNGSAVRLKIAHLTRPVTAPFSLTRVLPDALCILTSGLQLLTSERCQICAMPARPYSNPSEKLYRIWTMADMYGKVLLYCG